MPGFFFAFKKFPRLSPPNMQKVRLLDFPQPIQNELQNLGRDLGRKMPQVFKDSSFVLIALLVGDKCRSWNSK